MHAVIDIVHCFFIYSIYEPRTINETDQIKCTTKIPYQRGKLNEQLRYRNGELIE